jgi:hypothetical protein
VQLTHPDPHAVASLSAFTHWLPHSVMPLGHAQMPFVHTPPPGHALVHEPQCRALLPVSTQAPEQFVCPAGHWDVHWPLAQTWPDWHVRPH